MDPDLLCLLLVGYFVSPLTGYELPWIAVSLKKTGAARQGIGTIAVVLWGWESNRFGVATSGSMQKSVRRNCHKASGFAYGVEVAR